jgi:hypothetical protein
MNLDEWRQAKLRMAMGVGVGFLVVCWMLALILAIASAQDGATGTLIGAGVVSWLAIYLLSWLLVPIWRAGLVERYRGLPKPGVLVKPMRPG